MGFTALHEIACNVSPLARFSSSSFKALLNGGLDPNARDTFGKTALHHLADRWHVIEIDIDNSLYKDAIDMARMIISHGGDTEIKDYLGLTVLARATLWAACPLIVLLIAGGANANALCGPRLAPFFLSIEGLGDDEELFDDPISQRWSSFKSFDCVESQKLAHFALSSRDIETWTPLHLGVLTGSPTVVNLLLKSGSDVRITDSRGFAADDISGAFIEDLYVKKESFECILFKRNQRIQNYLDEARDTKIKRSTGHRNLVDGPSFSTRSTKRKQM
jgi:ankyrin repeat protein